MIVHSNIEDIIAKLERMKQTLAAGDLPPGTPNIHDAIFSATNAGMGKMKFRIFNKGMDAENVTLGKYVGHRTRITKKKYSVKRADEFDERDRKTAKRNLNREIKADPKAKYSEYEKYRLSRGRQIDYKDLEMDGALRRSIETVKRDGKIVIAIVNEETSKISFYQEQQIGNIRAGESANSGTAEPAKIFRLSQEEFEQVRDEGNAAIGQILEQLFNQI